MTNLEKIKSMNTEEMAGFLADACCRNCAFYDSESVIKCIEANKTCAEGIKIWLESEA